MDGRNLIGYKHSAMAKEILAAFSPIKRKVIDGEFHIATTEEIDEAMNLATSAFTTYRQTSGKDKAKFLNTIADEILALGDELIERAMEESGLPKGRITGERGRTMGQLRLFAKTLEEGSWVDAIIDQADRDRKPFPKSDIRRMLVPLGPVVVFTASNFPLAFSTAGGDTASALAAGNPVIVKAHESHLGTNALVALAIQRAAEKTGMPDGVFSSLNGTGIDLGQTLAKHPQAKAIAFTGSLRAGKAIFDTANQRVEPIPVFAEMGSINPVLLLEKALATRGEKIAQQYASSITLGVGQFCTNPGLLIGKQSDDLDLFIKNLAKNIEQTTPATMLNEGVCNNFENGQKRALDIPGVKLEGKAATEKEPIQGQASVASVSGEVFLKNKTLQEEVFGPFTLVVRCAADKEMQAVINSLNGQLTATVMGEKEELAENLNLIQDLQNKVGRILFNGVPTGVEVCAAMQHGGPFPATTDSRTTSVGVGAIKRFVRPLAFQDWEQELLPEALQDGNPLNIWRMLDGTWGQK